MTIICETDLGNGKQVFSWEFLETLKRRETDLQQQSALEIRSHEELFIESVSKLKGNPLTVGRGENGQHNDRGSCP